MKDAKLRRLNNKECYMKGKCKMEKRMAMECFSKTMNSMKDISQMMKDKDGEDF